ncbi:hypothetical protein [Ostreibacterium oceani]|uniref:Glycosyltransferase RgtA/B/C/D-like domain-containing protein n=1 Tax=Ostreibacterium oceani TaxID=2654998 RepID=A0A6N7EVQ6_9GAMM|nr:hypothetical protein [Ostreibacterium oceani]MPV85157.1 hypothetical protein [Ostreibacterium oceani]
MQYIRQTLLPMIYRHPIAVGMLLSVISGVYLIADYGIINRAALLPMWQLQQMELTQPAQSPYEVFGILGVVGHWLHDGLGLSLTASVYGLLLVVHAGIIGLILLITQRLQLALLTQWILLFLVLCHPNYNDFRTYLMNEPIYWLIWLVGVYVLLRFYRERPVFTGIIWIVLFLLAGQLSLAAWFWLLLFPFGAFLIKDWRSKSVFIALVCYAAVMILLMLFPLYHGESPLHFFIEIAGQTNRLSDWLRLNNAAWLDESDRLIPAIFVFSGATSIVLIHMMMSLGLVCGLLAFYAWRKKQYQVVHSAYLSLLIYVFIFDILVAILLWVFAAEYSGLYFFASVFLIFILAALGLSYVFKKLLTHRYPRHFSLVIIWCLVAYFASGYIIFGPTKTHIKAAGSYAKATLTDYPIYANDETFLYYAGRHPEHTASPTFVTELQQIRTFYYAYNKNRKRALPEILANKEPIYQTANSHNDILYLYLFSK